ncbi:transketolase family protein [Methanospirillum sp.]|uniref:transketolase family protein n=1 Tax=Methanospirillum sp. TaxID=45200 RepID=UPI0035A06FEA
MRDTCSRELTSLARSDPRIVILSGDIGNRMFDGFKEEFPDRFYNCGVAEANMISVAAGLALSGYRPFVYTFAVFDLTRCYEQIRIDLCFQNLPVVIIGLGGGLTYAPLGPTHYLCEDISILRCLPGMTIVCPADKAEVMAALQSSLIHPGPMYIRINKKNEPCIHTGKLDFSLGRAHLIQDGNDVCIITTGVLLSEVIRAADILEEHNISARIVHLHTIKPVDELMLQEIFSRFSIVVSVEEHTLPGGLGGMIAEWMADNRIKSSDLVRIGTGDYFLTCCFTQEKARDHFGISAKSIANKIVDELKHE